MNDRVQMPQSAEDKGILADWYPNEDAPEEFKMRYNAMPRTREWCIKEITDAEANLSVGYRASMNPRFLEKYGYSKENEREWRQGWEDGKRVGEATLEALYKANLPEDERPIGNNLTALNVYRTVKNQEAEGADAEFIQQDAALSSGAVSAALKFLEQRGLVDSRLGVAKGQRGRRAKVYTSKVYTDPVDL